MNQAFLDGFLSTHLAMRKQRALAELREIRKLEKQLLAKPRTRKKPRRNPKVKRKLVN